jgi:hypothetical protein
MGNPVRAHAAVGKVHQVKSRCARRKGEVGDADKIPEADAVAMALQSVERTPQQTGIYPLDSLRTPESDSGPCGPGSKAGKRKIDKKATGKYQDEQLQRK